MSRTIALASVTVAAASLLGAALFERPQETPKPEDMAAMMEKVKQFTQPGPEHKTLERFIGNWDTETRFMGQPRGEKGTAEYSWLMEGRWVKGEWSGTMMGMPSRGFTLLGYDRFKKSFVTTDVQNLDTAMRHSEGDLDRTGKTLITYGTLDEYLTGEHDKMVKYVWRFEADKMTLEVHDLPIGEQNTKVVEIVFTKKAGPPSPVPVTRRGGSRAP
jgi:hypothetical protein